MKKPDMKKSEPVITVEIIEYEPHSVISKTIINKSTGNVNIVSFDHGEELVEKTIPFESYVQIIDGSAEIIVNKTSHFLDTGQSIVIPANTPNIVKANVRFKMILSVIKCDY